MKKKIIIILSVIVFAVLLILINVFLNSQNNDKDIISQENNAKANVVEVTSQNFEEEVLKSDKPVLIDFYAEWCGPCKLLSPTVEEISNENVNVKFVKIDVDKSEDLAMKYEIMAMPTLVLIQDGEEKDRVVGLVDKSTILEFIK